MNVLFNPRIPTLKYWHGNFKLVQVGNLRCVHRSNKRAFIMRGSYFQDLCHGLLNGVLYTLWQTLYGCLVALERSHMNGLILIKQTTEIIVQHYFNNGWYNNKTIAAYESCYFVRYVSWGFIWILYLVLLFELQSKSYLFTNNPLQKTSKYADFSIVSLAWILHWIKRIWRIRRAILI